MKQNKYAFTLVELIVTITILVLLTSIGFYSYVQNLSDARDGVRKSDISTLSAQLSSYKKERGAYPLPWNSFEIQNRGATIALQWQMNIDVILSNAERLPLDPNMDMPYSYSTTINRQEYQLAATLENSDNPKALLVWDYSSVSRNLFPTLILALPNGPRDMIITPANRDYYIFDKNIHNLPYDFDTWTPVSDGTTLAELINEAIWNDYWQNSDFISCNEIARAGKRITPDGQTDQYQVRSLTWVLVNQDCSCTSTWCIDFWAPYPL